MRMCACVCVSMLFAIDDYDAVIFIQKFNRANATWCVSCFLLFSFYKKTHQSMHIPNSAKHHHKLFAQLLFFLLLISTYLFGLFSTITLHFSVENFVITTNLYFAETNCYHFNRKSIRNKQKVGSKQQQHHADMWFYFISIHLSFVLLIDHNRISSKWMIVHWSKIVSAWIVTHSQTDSYIQCAKEHFFRLNRKKRGEIAAFGPSDLLCKFL